MYIYVHGYNESFEDVLFDAAGLHQYLGRRGEMIAYCWPSRNSVFQYISDLEAAIFTVRHFRQLIRSIAKLHAVERIHIISHSMGGRIVGSALRELRLMQLGSDPEDLKVGHLVYLAPDVDLLIFKARCRRVRIPGRETGSERKGRVV